MAKFPTKYVAGFLFSADKKNVVLIRKNKPEWQKGKLNAVGGKVEDGEVPLAAMIREFKEETGVEITNWHNFCMLTNPDWEVSFFSAFSDSIPGVKSMTDEQIVICDVLTTITSDAALFSLGSSSIIPNLRWLIPMALFDPHHVFANAQAK